MDTMKNGVRVSPLPLGFDGYVGLTNQFYVSAGVLSGPHYPNGKPAFLQSWEYSRKLHITGGRVGLIVNFALGVTGGLFVNRSVAHYGTYVLEMPENPDKAYYIWAELNTDGATMSFGFSTKKKLTYSRFEPENPATGDYWFDIPSNIMKFRRSREVEQPSGEIEIEHYWEDVKRVILGWVAQGTDGYIYSMTSFPLHYWFAEQYPEYVKYDGVSLQTDGRFIAENYEAWKDNTDVCTNAANSSVARDAIYYGANLWTDPIGKSNEMLTGKMLVGWTEQDLDIGFDAVSYAGMDDLTNSEEGVENVIKSSTALDRTLENELAINILFNKEMPMEKVAHSEFALSKIILDDNALRKMANSLIASTEILESNLAIEKFKLNVMARTRLLTGILATEIYSNFINVRDDIFVEVTVEPTPSFYRENDHLKIYSYAGTNSSNEEDGHFITDFKVDVTNYSKLKIEWENTGADHPYNYSYFGLASSKTQALRLQNYIVEITRDFNKKIDELDISGITGQYYIGVSARSRGGTSGYASDLYIYKIWLEE